MRPVIRSRQAEDDLLDIWLYIATRDPGAADRVLDAIERRLRRLSVFPLSGPARDDIRPGIRHLVSGNYLILFRVSNTAVEILRVVHGRRNVDSDILNG